MKYLSDAEFGQKIRALAKSKGLTQEFLATKFDVSQSTIANWFSGNGLSLGTAQALAEAVGVDFLDIMAPEPGLAPVRDAMIVLRRLAALNEVELRTIWDVVETAEKMRGVPANTEDRRSK